MDDIEIPPITTTFQSNGTAATAVSKYSFLDLLPLDGDAEVVKIPTGPLIPSQPIMVDGKFVGIEAHPMDGSAPRDTYIWAGRDIIIPEAADVGVAGPTDNSDGTTTLTFFWFERGEGDAESSPPKEKHAVAIKRGIIPAKTSISKHAATDTSL